MALRRLTLCLMLACLAAWALLSHSQNADASRHRRVMLLFDGNLLQPSVQKQSALTQEAIAAVAGSDVEFFAEDIDSRLLQDARQEERFISLLQSRYATAVPDLVVAHGQMQEFIRRNRARLWPEQRWMMVGVVATQGSNDIPEGIPGTGIAMDVAGTIALARALQPQLRRLFVVSGSASSDRQLLSLAQPQLEKLRTDLDVRILPEGSFADLQSAVKDLPRDAALLQMPVTHDAAGRTLDPAEALRQIAAAASVPSYSPFEGSIGAGALGGAVANVADQQVQIGHIAGQLLRDNVTALPVALMTAAPSLCAVDWKQVQRWNIQPRSIPGECSQRFREPEFWQSYRAPLSVIGMVGVLLLGLVVALLMERRRKHEIEGEMTQQRAQLAHAARLATVGELSASIAHEIAQPLAAILSNAEAGEKLLSSGRGSRQDIHDILAAIREDDERACVVIQRLRDLLRRSPVRMQPVDINESIGLVVRLISGNAGQRGVQIDARLDPGLPRVRGDVVQLQQVLLNLIMNAVEAMSGSPLERRRVLVDSSVHPDGTVEVSVRDRGHGIPADQLRHIFEPFFSTKQDGMGLGLSISRSIVSAHGGRLWAESGREGTALRFTLVACEQENGDELEAATSAAAPAPAVNTARAT